MQYSGHDDGLTNTVLFLEPTNYELIDIPFASSVVLELHYDRDCVEKT